MADIRRQTIIKELRYRYIDFLGEIIVESDNKTFRGFMEQLDSIYTNPQNPFEKQLGDIFERERVFPVIHLCRKMVKSHARKRKN